MHGPKPVLWVVWLGFVMIGVEVRHLHANILTQPAATIPLFFCSVAVILIPMCLYRTTRARRTALLWLFSLGAAVGLVGVYFHTKLNIGPFLQLFSAERTPGPQPLAPLALTGLSTIGLFASRLIPIDPAKRHAAPHRDTVLDR